MAPAIISVICHHVIYDGTGGTGGVGIGYFKVKKN